MNDSHTIKHCDYQTPMIRMTEMMLEAEIAMYAESPAPRDVDLEMSLRDRVYHFLQDSHDAQYPKARYMRHVTFLIGQAIIARTGVPWEEVHSKAWMRGTKSNIPDEIAIASETFVPAPCVSSQRPGILKVRQLPSPPPPPLDPREPAPIAGRCDRCTRLGAPCQRKEGWVACIPCHQMRERCSLTPISRAFIQAAKNRATLDSSRITTAKGTADDLQRIKAEIFDKIRKVETRQEEISRGIQDILIGQKRLYEVISSWGSTEEHKRGKRKRNFLE